MASGKLNPIWEFLKGKDIETVYSLPTNLICVLCNKILINARQTPCGCRYCADCIVEEFKNGSKRCPGGTEDCSEQLLYLTRDITCDNNANREISKLIVKCSNKECPYEDELRKLPDHFDICEYKMDLCDKCNQSVLKKDMMTHNTNYCELRSIQCYFCGENFTKKFIVMVHNNVQHQLLCDQYKAMCPNNCGVRQTVVIKPHLNNCANRPEQCPYATIGCALVNIPRQLMNDHLSSEANNHAKTLVNYIDNLNNEITSLKTINAKQARYIEDLQGSIKKIDNLEMRHNDFIWKVERFSQLLKSAEKGKQLFIESKSFLSDRYGYKMSLKLFPNGEGDGKGVYISLYFMILNGKYDDLLEWPFKGAVTLSLLNCAGLVHHNKSGNFKPLSRHGPDMDVGAGCVKFFEIAQLADSGFLKNDNLYIKCAIN